MRKLSASLLPVTIEDLAEGSTGPHEAHEPESPLATTLVPIVKTVSTRTHHHGETGVIAAVDVPPEESEQVEQQDAPRSVDDDTRHEAAAPQQDAAPAHDVPAERQPLVFIVEDTTELAEVIQATLERMGMTTMHATHGERALSALKDVDPDVILLDISLPDMTGWKILDGLKEKYGDGTEPDSKHPTVIIISAYGDPANRLVGKLQGVYSYLIKPFTADEVEKIVTQALGSAAS